MKRYHLYLFDVDGTVYRGDEPTPGAADVIRELRARGAKVAFLTNNSGVAPEQVAEKLGRLGISCGPEDVVTSADAAAWACREREVGVAFVLGEEGLVRVLDRAGVEVVPPGSDEPADAVVVGICRHATYALLSEASHRVRRGELFIATNLDATYPRENGKLEPGAGAIVAAVRTASGVEPIVAGKPEPMIVHEALRRCGVGADRTLLVGDREDTDMAAARHAGVDAFLVLTGIETSAPPGRAFGADLRALL